MDRGEEEEEEEVGGIRLLFLSLFPPPLYEEDKLISYLCPRIERSSIGRGCAMQEVGKNPPKVQSILPIEYTWRL